ncbi:MAG TPA: autotransporter domain-containing protein [Rhodobiaceae bacterium]|nr:autotransporter domain-containing protein [Rhodobiaceae bacterium]
MKWDKEMKRNWLATTALTSMTLLTVGAVSSASASPHATTGFVATSTSGTTSALAPDLLMDEQKVREALLTPHLFTLFLLQQIANGQKPAGYAGGFETGVAAGEQAAVMSDKVSVWSSINYSEAESDFTATAYDSETVAGSVGLDYILSKFVTLGAYISYSDTDTNSTFNGGSSDTESFSIGPYASFVVDDMFSIDASIGYSTSDIDNSRTVGAVVATGNQDGDTVFMSIGLNGMKWYDNIGVSGRLGWSYSDTDNDAYTDSLGTAFTATDSQLGQIQLGGQVSYYTENFMPYVGATYVYDAISDDVTTVAPPQPDNDKDEVRLDAGVNIFGSGALSGGLSANYTVLREDYEGWGVGGNVSLRF